ncbi:MAG: universal stress protein [Candidatus Nanopelagicales bacterium]
MRTVLAAVDDGPAARDVLQTALAIGDLTGAVVEALHVLGDTKPAPHGLVDEYGVALRVHDGPTGPCLLHAMADDAVVAAVLGAGRSPVDRRPAGRTTIDVLEQTTKPVVVVPPHYPMSPAGQQSPPRRLLIPLEGKRESSRPVIAAIDHLVVAEVEMVVLHVLTDATMPPMLDRPGRDLSMWGDEFVARFCSPASRIEVRIGDVAARVADLASEDHVDLVVMSWSRISASGRAKVVHEVLATSATPILLLPVSVPARRP